MKTYKTLTLTISLLLLTITACRTCPQPPAQATHTTVATHTTIDTLPYRLPQQSATRTTNDTTSTLTTDYATSQARILPDGTLAHTLLTNPNPIPIPAKTITHDSIVWRDRTHTLTVPAQLTPWQHLRINAFPWLTATLLLITATIYIRRRTRPK